MRIDLWAFKVPKIVSTLLALSVISITFRFYFGFVWIYIFFLSLSISIFSFLPSLYLHSFIHSYIVVWVWLSLSLFTLRHAQHQKKNVWKKKKKDSQQQENTANVFAICVCICFMRFVVPFMLRSVLLLWNRTYSRLSFDKAAHISVLSVHIYLGVCCVCACRRKCRHAAYREGSRCSKPMDFNLLDDFFSLEVYSPL